MRSMDTRAREGVLATSSGAATRAPRPPDSKLLRMALAGTSAAASQLVCHPIETVKVRGCHRLLGGVVLLWGLGPCSVLWVEEERIDRVRVLRSKCAVVAVSCLFCCVRCFVVQVRLQNEANLKDASRKYVARNGVPCVMSSERVSLCLRGGSSNLMVVVVDTSILLVAPGLS